MHGFDPSPTVELRGQRRWGGALPPDGLQCQPLAAGEMSYKNEMTREVLTVHPMGGQASRTRVSQMTEKMDKVEELARVVKEGTEGRAPQVCSRSGRPKRGAMCRPCTRLLCENKTIDRDSSRSLVCPAVIARSFRTHQRRCSRGSAGSSVSPVKVGHLLMKLQSTNITKLTRIPGPIMTMSNVHSGLA